MTAEPRLQLASMPWYPRDFRSATLGWPLVARAVYRELLDAQWDVGGLPTDAEMLRAICMATPDEWRLAWPIVAPKFERGVDGRLRNLRLEAHRERALQRAADNRDKAKKAANARWTGNAPSTAPGNAPSTAPSTDPVLGALLEQCPPTPTPRKEEDSPLANARGAPVAEATSPDTPQLALNACTRPDGNENVIDFPSRLPKKRQLAALSALHQQILDAYHQLLPDLPAVKIWNDRRRKKLDARIRETLARGKAADTPDWWGRLFEHVAASDFLMGRKTDWRCPGLEWLLESRHFDKIIEGGYADQHSAGARR